MRVDSALFGGLTLFLHTHTQTTGRVLWDRLAAAESRLTQHHFTTLRMSTPVLRRRSIVCSCRQVSMVPIGVFARVFLNWSILRIPMNLCNPRREPCNDWLGVQLQTRTGGVDVSCRRQDRRLSQILRRVPHSEGHASSLSTQNFEKVIPSSHDLLMCLT